jgi:hypothetical protein
MDIERLLTLRPFWGRRAEFYQDIAASIDARELLRDFVDGEWRIASNPATADKTKASFLGYMRRLMESGVTALPDVLERVMPASDAMGIAVIADSQDQAAALRFVAQNVEEQSAMGKVIATAVTSPAVLAPIAFVFAYVMAAYVIPAFEQGAPAEVWTGFAAVVRNTAVFFKVYAPIVVSVLLGALTWFAVHGLANITARWRYQAESAVGAARLPWMLLGPVRPILTMYRDIQAARMLANLATLLQAGRGLQDSLAELAKHASPWMRKHLLWVLEHMQLNPGDNVPAFSQGILSATLLARLHTKVRRDAGADFARVLIDIGTLGQEQARADVQRYAQRLNVVLLVSVLGVILFFYAGQNYILLRIRDETTPQAIQKRALKRQQPAIEATPVSAARSTGAYASRATSATSTSIT